MKNTTIIITLKQMLSTLLFFFSCKMFIYRLSFSEYFYFRMILWNHLTWALRYSFLCD